MQGTSIELSLSDVRELSADEVDFVSGGGTIKAAFVGAATGAAQGYADHGLGGAIVGAIAGFINGLFN